MCRVTHASSSAFAGSAPLQQQVIGISELHHACCLRMDTSTREWDLVGVYCKAWPEGFLSMADVCLLVEGKHLPAHSQFLASKSAVIRKMLEDCPAYSKQQPLALTEALARYKTADIQTFLKHVYKNTKVLTPTEAVQLLNISDHLDCPELTQHAVRYLESHCGQFLKATCEDTGALYWLQVAHQFNLDGFTERCMHFVSDHHQALQEDPRMQLLSPRIFLQLMQRQQEVLQAELGLHQAQGEVGVLLVLQCLHRACTATR